MMRPRSVSRNVALKLFKGPYKITGHEINFKICPKCNRDKWRFYVNPRKGVAWCHHCQFRPLLAPLAGKKGDYIDLDAADFYKEESIDPELPPAGSKFLESMDMMHPVFGFIRKRRFTPALLERYNAMYCARGKMRNRLLFPFQDSEGAYLGYQGRYIYNLDSDSKTPKWRQGAHCDKRKILFNFDRVFLKQDWCVLSEGIFDCLRQPDWSVAMFGKTPSREQREKLEYFRYIYIMLDEDASDQALKLARTLVSNAAFRVAPILLQKGDPDDHSVEELVETITSQVPKNWPKPNFLSHP